MKTPPQKQMANELTRLGSQREYDYPVLFLDFDGVLHPAKLACLDISVEGRIMVNRTIDEVLIFLPVLTKLLSPFREFRVVVSSSWRWHHTERELRDLLGSIGDRMIGTISKDKTYISRLHEILGFVDEFSIRHWVALDDDLPFEEDIIDLNGPEVARRCIKTYPDLGLGCNETQEQLKLSLIAVMNEWEADGVPMLATHDVSKS